MNIGVSLFDEEYIAKAHERSIIKEHNVEFAKRMIKRGKLTLEEIAEDSGLTIEEVEKLKSEIGE